MHETFLRERAKGIRMIDVDWIIRFEADELEPDEIYAGFQRMIDDGTVWDLQGSYGHTAVALIEAGLCTR